MTEDTNKLLAEVNGKKIYQEDVYQLMQNIEDNQRFNSEEGLHILADEMINQEILLADAYNEGYDKDKEFVDELELVKNNMLKNYAMHKIFEQVKIDEAEVKQYYEANKETLNPPILYEASHILVNDLAEAQKIKEEIDKGLEFAVAAKKYSIDPSKANGGSLGKFPKGVMVKEFQDGLDSINIGEVSKPIKSQFGYHLIKLENKENVDTTSFDKIKDQVYQRLLMVKRQEAYLDKLSKIKKDLDIKKYY